MKKILTFIVILVGMQSMAQMKKAGFQNFVFDNEKDFSQSQSDSLQQLLEGHYEKTGDVIVMVTTDSLGGEITLYADHFGINQKLGGGNTSNSMIIAFSKKDRQFGMVPNKKMQTILTQQDLDQIKMAGLAELKAHQFFQGIWKECKAVIDFLEKIEGSN